MDPCYHVTTHHVNNDFVLHQCFQVRNLSQTTISVSGYQYLHNSYNKFLPPLLILVKPDPTCLHKFSKVSYIVQLLRSDGPN